VNNFIKPGELDKCTKAPLEMGRVSASFIQGLYDKNIKTGRELYRFRK